MEDWCSISHIFVTVFLVNFVENVMNPAIPDVTVAAVCIGEDGCSAAINLTGIQQAVSGIRSVFMMPLIRNLSDIYGRKRLLTLPIVLAIIPSALLACKRTTIFVYAYIIKTVTAMVTQGGIVGISLAYLVSVVMSIAMLIYMGVYLKDTNCCLDALEQPIMKVADTDGDSLKGSVKIDLIKKFPKDVLCLLRSGVQFSLAAVVAFFSSLAEAGLQSCLLYFLKAAIPLPERPISQCIAYYILWGSNIKWKLLK